MGDIFKGKLKWVPKWAQKYIAYLEEGYDFTENTQVTWRLHIGSLGPGEHYLPNEAVIRFNLGEGKDIEFMLLDNNIRVYTYHNRPIVETQASNTLIISVEKGGGPP